MTFDDRASTLNDVRVVVVIIVVVVVVVVVVDTPYACRPSNITLSIVLFLFLSWAMVHFVHHDKEARYIPTSTTRSNN